MLKRYVRIFRCSRPRCTAARWSTSIAGLRRRSLVAVIDTVDYLHRELNANIHRGVHRLAEEATERYEAARDRIRAFIGAAHREEVDLHGGGDGIAQHGGLRMGRYVPAGGRQYRRERDGAPLEPRSVAGWSRCARGPNCAMLPFDDAGRLMTERLDGLIDGRTRMVAVTQASNTLGTRPDLRPIVEAAHAVGALVCVDGCQGIVHGGADVAGAGVRLLCLFGTQALRPDRYRRALRAGANCSMRCLRSSAAAIWWIRVSFGGTTYAPLAAEIRSGHGQFRRARSGWARRCRYLEQFDPAEIESSRTGVAELCRRAAVGRSTGCGSTARHPTNARSCRSRSRGRTPTTWG